MNKKLIKILIIVLVALFVLGALKNFVAKLAIEGGVKAVTGLPLKMRKFDFGILRTLVNIQDLKIYNPKGFPDPIMLDMPEIYVDYNLSSLIKGKAHVSNMRINLKEFVVVKNKDGVLNLDSLKGTKSKEEKSQATPGAKAKPKKKGKAPKIQIDNLELKIGKVIYKDYSKGDKPRIKEYNVNLNEKYENISNPRALLSLIVFKALAKTSLASVVDLDTYKNIASGATKTAKKVAVKTAETAKKAAGAASDAVKKTAEGIGNLLPFGSKK